MDTLIRVTILSPRAGSHMKLKLKHICTWNRDCNTATLKVVGILLERKCPESRKYLKPSDLIFDPNIYVILENNSPGLKLNYPNSYFSQIQLARGVCDIPLCDFVVYTFNGLIIIGAKSDEKRFTELLKKLHIIKKAIFLTV